MNDPEKDIRTVVYRLTATESPDVQKATIEKYMTPNVSFRHPLCQVNSGPNSRNQVLGIFQYVLCSRGHISFTQCCQVVSCSLAKG